MRTSFEGRHGQVEGIEVRVAGLGPGVVTWHADHVSVPLCARSPQATPHGPVTWLARPNVLVRELLQVILQRCEQRAVRDQGSWQQHHRQSRGLRTRTVTVIMCPRLSAF